MTDRYHWKLLKEVHNKCSIRSCHGYRVIVLNNNKKHFELLKFLFIDTLEFYIGQPYHPDPPSPLL